jgi:prevent-host-death family protein
VWLAIWVVRRVERGEVFEITKDGEPVAVLAPFGTWSRKVTGFARIEVRGDLELPAGDWTYDVGNLGAPKRPPRR